MKKIASVAICPHCGYNHNRDILRNTSDFQMSEITRTFLLILGLIILGTGLPISSQISLASVQLLAYAMTLAIAGLPIYWAVAGTITSKHLSRLWLLAPLSSILGCVMSVLVPLFLIALVAMALFSKLAEWFSG